MLLVPNGLERKVSIRGRCDSLMSVSLSSGIHKIAAMMFVTNLAMLLDWQISAQARADVRQGRYRSTPGKNYHSLH